MKSQTVIIQNSTPNIQHNVFNLEGFDPFKPIELYSNSIVHRQLILTLTPP